MAEAENALKTAVLQERLEGHERVCTERYGEIKNSFGRVHDRLDGINVGVRIVLASMVLFLMGIIGTLLMTGLPWEKAN